MKLSKSPDAPKTPLIQSPWGARFAVAVALAGTPACAAHQSPNFTTTSSEETKVPGFRDLTPPEDKHLESSEASKRALALKGYMDPKEVIAMQGMHEKMYAEYMNPALMQYLKQTGLADKVYPSLDLIMKHPHAFEYVQKSDGMMEVTKQRPYTDEHKHIPNDFKVVMDSRAGNIVEVAGKDLRNPKGNIPWISNAKYNGRMADYRERWGNERDRQKQANIDSLPLTEPERTRAWRERPNPLMTVSKDMQDMFELDNVHFPSRLLALVAARGTGFDFEDNDPRILDIKKYQALQGGNYSELIKNNNLHIMVTADPKVKGAYQIRTTGLLASTPLRVTAEGYMMTQKPDGSWIADPRYDKALSKQYYKAHPQAPKNG